MTPNKIASTPDNSPDLVRINLFVTEEQKRFLKVRAAMTGVSISSWLRSVVDAEMADQSGV